MRCSVWRIPGQIVIHHDMTKWRLTPSPPASVEIINWASALNSWRARMRSSRFIPPLMQTTLYPNLQAFWANCLSGNKFGKHQEFGCRTFPSANLINDVQQSNHFWVAPFNTRARSKRCLRISISRPSSWLLTIPVTSINSSNSSWVSSSSAFSSSKSPLLLPLVLDFPRFSCQPLSFFRRLSKESAIAWVLWLTCVGRGSLER